MTDLAKPFFDKTFDTFWYDSQFVKSLIEFMAIFSGMKIQIGKNSFNSQTNKIIVPIRRGNADRVVNAIISKGSNASPLQLPIMSAEIVQIEKIPERQKGRESVIREPYLPVGGDIVDDVKIVYKKTPTPYIIHFDLSILTSNDDQKFQILEQILTVFDPNIQIQLSDDIFQWNKIQDVILDDIQMDSKYPYGTDQKIISTTLNFSSVVYLQVPIQYKSNFIKSIKLRLESFANDADLYNKFVESTINPEEGYVEVANIDELSELDNLKS